MILKNLGIDGSWTLFLDRDGVINRRIEGDYVKKWSQFEFLPGVKESLKILAPLFGKIIVVTNQQGIGKKMMTGDDLAKIHEKMAEEVAQEGGRIDRVYYSPHLEKEGSFLRKPAVGMAVQARRDFPEINFKKSIMAGDSLSDMVFGHRCGMKTVLISGNPVILRENHRIISFSYPDLKTFAEAL